MLSEGLGSSVRPHQALRPLSHSGPSALPASGADTLPMTADFMSLDSALARPGALPTDDERGRAFGGPAAASAVWFPLRAGDGASTTVSGGLPGSRGASRSGRARPCLALWWFGLAGPARSLQAEWHVVGEAEASQPPEPPS